MSYIIIYSVHALRQILHCCNRLTHSQFESLSLVQATCHGYLPQGPSEGDSCYRSHSALNRANSRVSSYDVFCLQSKTLTPAGGTGRLTLLGDKYFMSSASSTHMSTRDECKHYPFAGATIAVHAMVAGDHEGLPAHTGIANRVVRHVPVVKYPC